MLFRREPSQAEVMSAAASDARAQDDLRASVSEAAAFICQIVSKAQAHAIMQNQPSTIVFDQDRAATYDQLIAKSASLRDALHFAMRLVLAELPPDARVLCVGVGTGMELVELAQAFPQWQFTAVDPASSMLALCRQKAEESGMTSRCTFHEGYLDTLPVSEPFDAATCLLVSHSILEIDARRDFFRQIAARLCPGGYLVNADLASDTSTVAYRNLLEVWLRMMRYSGVPEADIEKYLTAYNTKGTLRPPQEVASIIASGGFEAPVLFLQTLLIHAWFAKRSA